MQWQVASGWIPSPRGIGRPKLKWYKSGQNPRLGPPKERVDSVLSTMPIFKAAMAGGVADAKALWPEVAPSGQWSSASDTAEWEGKWRRANMKPLEIWRLQGTGVGLPLIIPLNENPRGDKALMDQLVDSGSRTIKGVAAVNGPLPSGRCEWEERFAIKSVALRKLPQRWSL